MNSAILEQQLTADLLKIPWFLGLSRDELAQKTNFDKPRWSRLFRGTEISEATLNRLAAALEMQPHSLLFAISLRREEIQMAVSKPKRVDLLCKEVNTVGV